MRLHQSLTSLLSALFFNRSWCSLFQPPAEVGGKPRTVAEELTYHNALLDMDLWYAHAMTTVVLLTDAPASGTNYYTRAWPTFEAHISRWLKTRRADLWDPIIEVPSSGKTNATPPMDTEAFKELLGSLWVRTPSDRDRLLELYARALTRTFSRIEVLRYDRCGWGSTELETLAGSLPLCSRVTHLDLQHNACGSGGLVALINAISRRGALPMLRELNLANNQHVGDWRTSLLALAEAVSPRTLALSRLQVLGLDDCRIGHHAFFYFCRGIRRGGLPSLTRLNIDGNHVENSGIEPLAQALSRGAMPSLRIVTGIPRDGMQLSDARSILQLKHLRELAKGIDSEKDDLARCRGTAGRSTNNNKEVARLDAQIRIKQEALHRHRGQLRVA